ncbi:hypothetical protein BZA70DRAFT_291263 [Myxozyma melibiosi]|uniref:Uncharacterized protein n=1 Tax=Myxozyma melibiosi TaxID=54550 RepID=A0ABR1F1G2_9ASCO
MSPATQHMADASHQLNSYGRRHPGLYLLGGTVLITMGAMGYWAGISGGSSESFAHMKPSQKNKWAGSEEVKNSINFPLADHIKDTKRRFE